MKFRYLHFVLVFLTAFSAIPCWCQATPLAALEELITTEKPAVAEKHYPEPVRKALGELKKEDRAQMSQKLLLTEWLRKQHFTVQKSDQGNGWDLLLSGKKFRTFSIADTYFSGSNALVQLKVKPAEQPEAEAASYFVAMRMEAGDWQITGFGQWQPMSLESDEFVHRFIPTADNETSAKSNLRQIWVALMRYRALYPKVGYPSKLEALSGPDEPEETASQSDDQQEQEATNQGSQEDQAPDPAPQYAHILDSSFMGLHVIKDGYEFHYTLIDPGNPGAPEEQGEFRVTATPVEFGKTGSRSFLINQTGLIHFTAEGREAADTDPIIHSAPAYEGLAAALGQLYYRMLQDQQ